MQGLFQHRGLLTLVSWYLKARFRFKVEGLMYAHQAVATGKGVLLAGNHTGLLDTLLVSVAYPRPVTFLMREEVLDWKIVGPLIRRANVLVLWRDRLMSQLRNSIERLQAGEHLVIFPEGELTHTGQLNRFNDGVGLLWQKGDAILLPFVIHGGYDAWQEGEWHATGVPVCLEFLPPMPWEPHRQRHEIPEQLQAQIQQALNIRMPEKTANQA